MFRFNSVAPVLFGPGVSARPCGTDRGGPWPAIRTPRKNLFIFLQFLPRLSGQRKRSERYLKLEYSWSF